MSKHDIPVRRPGHGGSRSRRTPTSSIREKKETDVGEFSPNTDWDNYEYQPTRPILRECINPRCQRVTYMYYSYYGESFHHILECGICGAPQEEE